MWSASQAIILQVEWSLTLPGSQIINYSASHVINQPIIQIINNAVISNSVC